MRGIWGCWVGRHERSCRRYHRKGLVQLPLEKVWHMQRYASTWRGLFKWTGLSLATLLITIWICSGWYSSWLIGPRWYWISSLGPRMQLSIRSGRLHAGWWSDPGPTSLPNAAWFLNDDKKFFGIQFRWQPEYRVPDGSEPWPRIIIPLWMFLLAISIPTALAWRRVATSRNNLKAQQCAHCSYCVIGLPQQAICPECGKVQNPI